MKKMILVILFLIPAALAAKEFEEEKTWVMYKTLEYRCEVKATSMSQAEKIAKGTDCWVLKDKKYKISSFP